jgi:hypothetical protein
MSSHKIPLSDLSALFRREIKNILKKSFLVTLFILLYVFSSPFLYKAEAVFQEERKSVSGFSDEKFVLSHLMGGAADKNAGKAQALMKSKKILVPLIEEQGLAAQITPYPPSKVQAFIKKMKRMFYMEANFFDKKTDLPKGLQDKEIFAVHVHYPLKQKTTWRLHFFNKKQFAIYRGRIFQCIGEIDEALVLPKGICLTLKSRVIKGATFQIVLSPLEDVLHAAKKKLHIKVHDDDPLLLNLAFEHEDRHKAKNFLNGLMQNYSKHLLKENDKIHSGHISYLNERRSALKQQLDHLSAEHATALSSNCLSLGFLDAAHAIAHLSTEQKSFKEKLNRIELSLEEITSLEDKPFEKIAVLPLTHIPLEFSDILKRIHALQLKEDILTQSISISKKNFIPTKKSAEVLENLLLEHSAELNACEKLEEISNNALKKIEEPTTQLSALTSQLKDSVSQEVLLKMSELSFSLKDENNRSEKEKAQLKSQIEVYTVFLKDHVENIFFLNTERKKQLETKVESLKQEALYLIYQEKELFLRDFFKKLQEYKESLLKNTEFLKKQENDLVDQLAYLPSKLFKEKQLEKGLKIEEDLIHEIERALESKNISKHTDISQAKALDNALLPYKPHTPSFLLVAFFSFFSTGLISSSFTLFKEFFQGFTVSKENLELKGVHVLGDYPRRRIADRKMRAQTIKNAATYFTCGKKRPLREALLYIQGYGPDILHELGEEITLRGYSVLMIKPSMEKSYLDAEESVHVFYYHSQKMPFETSLQSKAFLDIFYDFKKKYDYILCTAPLFPASLDPQAFMLHFENILLCLSDEKLYELEKWMFLSKKYKNNLSCILYKPLI